MADDQKLSSDTAMADDQKPSSETAMADDEQPILNDAMADNQKPSSETAMADDQQPRLQDALADNQKPSSETAMADDQKPTLETAMADDQQPILEVAVADNQEPSSENINDDQKRSSETTMADYQKPFSSEEVPVIKKQNKPQKPHCLLVPYPTPGHINPFLQFSKCLQLKGVKVTIALTQFIYRTMDDLSKSGIAIETFSDGKEEVGEIEIGAYLVRLKEIGNRTLIELVKKLNDQGSPVDCIVYDSFLTWAQDVARDFHVAAAVFFTQSCAVDVIYYHAYKGLLKLPIPAEGQVVIPGLPPLEPPEMPSFICDVNSYPASLEYMLDQFSNFDKADWLFFNTFFELEKEALQWMQKQWPVKTVGPMVPSMYLDKRIGNDKEYGMNLFNPNTETCIKWLDQRLPGSVAYIAFGSLAELGLDQMEELAMGLKASNKNFLWVVRATEENKLPVNFREETMANGLVVSWAPQLEVLAHDSVACFVTHCGWNSILEALSLGVPVVAMGQWTDQPTNAKFSTEVWKNGIRARRSINGLVTREEVEYCLKEIMEGERAKDIRKNAIKWKEAAIKAMDEGGSSDKNISDFVASLIQS